MKQEKELKRKNKFSKIAIHGDFCYNGIIEKDKTKSIPYQGQTHRFAPTTLNPKKQKRKSAGGYGGVGEGD
ncbi:MAG: hypothetical protein U9O66_02065 [Patescibacteria group bacterium]|nr:hypothetical protein [Patescibacteria group bacterium]